MQNTIILVGDRVRVKWLLGRKCKKFSAILRKKNSDDHLAPGGGG